MPVSSLKKRHHILRPTHLVLLIVLLAGNTFAWFIYATKVNSDISVHVRSWNVVFQTDDNEITNNIPINIDSIYPGMTDFRYDVTAYNRSEVSARLSYQILSARILDVEYVTVEEKNRLGLTVNEGDITCDELEEMLANNYPFKLNVEVSNPTINFGNGIERYSVMVTWPFESDDDEADTLWGTNAYTYKQNNPDSPSIAINIRVSITQNAN